MTTQSIEAALRDAIPRVVATLTRRYGAFSLCEDAVQEAAAAAALQWSADELPDNPTGWLHQVATRRLIEMMRNNSARRQREINAVNETPSQDDELALIFLCCHPALSGPSQVALTLRVVGGLTTAEIAKAFLVPETTIGQRISRAKKQIEASTIAFELPSSAERDERLTSVLSVLYAIFNEGYTASSGHRVHRVELAQEAIRLTRQLQQITPNEGEVAGLLALMVLTNARRDARIGENGELIPTSEQDRSLWDAAAIDEGVTLLSRTLSTAPIGPYQLQAAIAAVHDEAANFEDTDWQQILHLYGLLEQVSPGPMVTLNRIIAVAMVEGPMTGLQQLSTAEQKNPVLTTHYRVSAVKAHLFELAGDLQSARNCYIQAAQETSSLPERRYLETRLSRMAPDK